MKPASLHFAAGTASPATMPSPFRARYAGGVNLEKLSAHYRGAPGKPDNLIWERYHDIIATQDLPHANLAKLVAEGVLRIPHDATTIFIDEYTTICRCSEGYAHWGTMHIGNHPVKQGRARSFLITQLMDMGVSLGEVELKSMVQQLCHGEHYMISGHDISMVVPKGKGRVFLAAPCEVASMRRNHWEELAERRAAQQTPLSWGSQATSEDLVVTSAPRSTRPRLALSATALAARAEAARKTAQPYNGAQARERAAVLACRRT